MVAGNVDRVVVALTDTQHNATTLLAPSLLDGGATARVAVTLDHAAILMANDLRYTQNEAAICGHGTRVEFSPSGDGYTAVYSSGKPIANPVGGDNLARRYSFDAIFRGVRLETRGGEQAIEFDRNGFAKSALEVALYYQGGERLVRLESGSGIVTIDGLETEWKDDGL